MRGLTFRLRDTGDLDAGNRRVRMTGKDYETALPVIARGRKR